MINTTGLSQYAIISALEYVAGRKLWYLPAQNGCRESWAFLPAILPSTRPRR